MKRALVSLILTAILSATFCAPPALAAGPAAPAITSATLVAKGDKWCELSLRWSSVAEANAGYELTVTKSSGLSKTVSPGQGTTSVKFTVSNDDHTVKIRSVRRSASGEKSYSAYATARVERIDPVLTLNTAFLAVCPGAGAQLRGVTVPKSDVTFSVADPGIASVSASGYVTGKKHGTTQVTIKSGSKRVTAKIYVSYTTSQIQAVCDAKGFASGAYWSYSKSAGDPSAYTASGHKATTSSASKKDRPGDGDYVGYTFDLAAECMGFAHYVGYKISGQAPKKGWTKLSSVAAVKAAGGLQIGDILRTNSHSALVYRIGGDGTLYFVEAWGSNNNLIQVNGRFAGNAKYVSLDTIPGFNYVYRCEQ